MAYFGVNEHGRWDANLAKAQFHTHVQNILKKYDEASSATKRSGTEWYLRAHDEAEKVGRGDVKKGAGIIAALSPLTDWDKNVAYAHQLVNTGDSPSTLIRKNVEKAQRIHFGEDPDKVLGGHKVTAFYKNIVNPSDPEPVTIDRHAYDIAMGHPFVGTGRKSTPRGGGGKMSPDLGLTKSVGRNQHFQYGYKFAAGERNIEIPNVMQAITWVQHRGGV